MKGFIEPKHDVCLNVVKNLQWHGYQIDILLYHELKYQDSNKSQLLKTHALKYIELIGKRDTCTSIKQ